MALSTKKINMIIADHKAGRFKSKTAFAKHYKIHRNTLNKIVQNIEQENTHAVEVGVQYEIEKKSAKSVQEIKAIERAVEERVNTFEIDNELITNNRKILKEVQGNIASYFVPDEEGKITPLDPLSIKQITGAVKDIEGVANPKDSSTKIDIKNQNNVVIPTMEDLYK